MCTKPSSTGGNFSLLLSFFQLFDAVYILTVVKSAKLISNECFQPVGYNQSSNRSEMVIVVGVKFQTPYSVPRTQKDTVAVDPLVDDICTGKADIQ